MKLLFITQKVDKNDDVLGVYHRWIEELAKKTEQIQVICLYKGKVEMPGNVVVHSLGKEQMASGKWQMAKRLVYSVRFYRYVWQLRKSYDTVFVHMNPEYVILAGWLWRILGKRVVFWYAHYLSNFKLRVAALFPHLIVTSTRLAFPFPSKKLRVLQQGIDTEQFKPSKLANSQTHKLKVLYLGRIAPVKNLDVLISALQLVNQKTDARLSVVGSPTAGKPIETEYLEQVKKLTTELGLSGRVDFEKSVPNILAPEIYRQHDLFVNLTVTGSFDKSTLEAMACGTPVLVSNLAFREILSDDLRESLMFKEGDHQDLAEKMVKFAVFSAQEREMIGGRLRDIIVKQHGLVGLTEKLYEVLSNDN